MGFAAPVCFRIVTIPTKARNMDGPAFPDVNFQALASGPAVVRPWFVCAMDFSALGLIAAVSVSPTAQMTGKPDNRLSMQAMNLTILSTIHSSQNSRRRNRL
jgi:hypothetical protein